MAASQDDSRGDTKEKGCCDEGVAWEGPLEFYRTPDRAEVAPNELDVTLCNGLCCCNDGCLPMGGQCFGCGGTAVFCCLGTTWCCQPGSHCIPLCSKPRGYCCNVGCACCACGIKSCGHGCKCSTLDGQCQMCDGFTCCFSQCQMCTYVVTVCGASEPTCSLCFGAVYPRMGCCEYVGVLTYRDPEMTIEHPGWHLAEDTLGNPATRGARHLAEDQVAEELGGTASDDPANLALGKMHIVPRMGESKVVGH